jgi:carbon monoxide dehydrogenase subunit G
MKLESKIGKLTVNDEKVYGFITNFNNFKHLIPDGKVKNWQSDENSCSFTVDPVGDIGFIIIEKQPFSLVKLGNKEGNKIEFNFWVQLKQVESNDTRIKLTMEVKLNSFMEMMAKKPLQEFLDKLVDQMEQYKFE